MPVQVRCKQCGYIIEERGFSNFDYFDPYKLPEKCPNCGRKLDNIMNAHVKVFPINTAKQNSGKKSYGRVHRYVFTAGMNTRMAIWCQYEHCKKRIKVGDKVVSVRTSKGKRLQYHEECYEKVMKKKVFPFAFRRKSKR